MSATVHKLPHISEGPDVYGNKPKAKSKTHVLFRKVGGIYHIRLGRFRISICRVKG